MKLQKGGVMRSPTGERWENGNLLYARTRKNLKTYCENRKNRACRNGNCYKPDRIVSENGILAF